MKKLLLLVIPTLFLLSCGSEKKQSGSGMGISPKEVAKLLNEGDIYKQDTVYARIGRATHDQITKAKQLFMQGLNFYINKKEPANAVASFRESILYYPDYQTYTYLGNAYIDMGDSARADSALQEYEMPDADRVYAFARLFALKKDTVRAIDNLREAFGTGFMNKKRLENDKIFDFLRSERAYSIIVVTYLKDDAKLRAALFENFLATAPELKLPFQLGIDSVRETSMEVLYSKSSINYDFATFISGMEDSRFSRDVSNSYYMVGRFKGENHTQCVLYKSVIVMADTLPPVEVKLAVFDSVGNLLDETTFAQYSLPETLLTGSVNESGEISIRENKMKWKNDPNENGYAGNEYTGEDLIQETKYKIGVDGKLISAPGKDDVVKK